MVDVRVSWLQSFVAVAEERHFGRAASRVSHSASAVSRHIRGLEHVVGRPLFERTTRSVVLTAAGRQLYHDVATSVDALTRAFGAVPGPSSAVVIGYVGAAAEHLVPDLAWTWSRSSDVELQLVPASSHAQLEAITAGTMDVGVQWAGPRDTELLVTTRLLTEPMRVALPATHPRAGADSIRLDELADETWLMSADRTDRVVRDHLADVCAQRGFAPRIKDAATGHAAQVHLVAAGHGICLVPRTAVSASRAPVSFVVIESVEVDLVAVTRPHPTPPVQELVAVLGHRASLGPRSPSFTSG